MSEGMDLNAVLASLPHGPEFRLVDSLVELVPGESGVGLYRLRGDEAGMAGHFPGAPEMPGVFMIEALAQLGGVVAQSDPTREPLAGLRLAAVRGAKILGQVTPGEELRIAVEVKGRLDALVLVEGTIRCGDRVVLKGAISLSGVVP